jgi:hypothetical protein
MCFIKMKRIGLEIKQGEQSFSSSTIGSTPKVGEE